jgi:hypothetical protein
LRSVSSTAVLSLGHRCSPSYLNARCDAGVAFEACDNIVQQ